MHLVKIMILSVMSGCILLVSCSMNPRVEKTFPVVDKVEASYHRIEEILGIVNIIKLNDYIVLQNGSEGVADFFFVYSCPEMEFLYSFAKKGRGPRNICCRPSPRIPEGIRWDSETMRQTRLPFMS